MCGARTLHISSLAFQGSCFRFGCGPSVPACVGDCWWRACALGLWTLEAHSTFEARGAARFAACVESVAERLIVLHVLRNRHPGRKCLCRVAKFASRAVLCALTAAGFDAIETHSQRKPSGTIIASKWNQRFESVGAPMVEASLHTAECPR